jgi:hypothetical protein
MERAAARVQPFCIKAYFLQAFELWRRDPRARKWPLRHQQRAGGHRNHATERGLGAVSTKYERICFEKTLINLPDKLPATFICPGHPLLDATIGLMLERERDTLKRGGVLVDETDPGQELRALFYLQQAIQDAAPTRTGERRVISHEVHFVEIDNADKIHANVPLSAKRACC